MILLFIHEVSYPDKVVFEMHEFPELLAWRGHDVTYLDYPEGRKFWKPVNSMASRQIRGRTKPNVLLHLERPFTLGVPGLDRLVATVTVIPKLISLLRGKKFDAIVLYAVPTYGAQVVWLAKRFGVPVIFRALDVSHKIRKSPFATAIKVVEKYIYKNVDLLSANNPAMAKYCNKFGNRTKPTLVHLPPLDLSHFSKLVADSELQKKLQIESSDSVITYLGSFFYFSGLDEVIKEFALLTEKRQNVKLLLIGGGEQDVELRRLVKNLDLQTSVIFTGIVPYAELNRYLSLATVAINPMIAGLVSNTAFPHKVLQYMASGLPVVTTKLDGLYETFGDTAGLTWATTPKEVVQLAINLCVDTKLRDAKSRIQVGAMSSKFGGDSAVEAFEASVKQVAHRL